MKKLLRFVLPAIGAFVLGVFPGMNWLRQYAATSPAMLSAADEIFLIIAFSCSGALSGIVGFRVLSWTKPIGTDVALLFVYTVVFGLIGFSYYLRLVV